MVMKQSFVTTCIISLMYLKFKIPPVRERTERILYLWCIHLINRYNERYDLHQSKYQLVLWRFLLKYPWL